MSFYKFVPISSPETTCKSIERVCSKESTLGTVLVASEGINAALGHFDREALDRTLGAIRKIEDLVDIVPKWSETGKSSVAFDRLIVRPRNEIVSLGRQFDFRGIRPPRLSPEKWAQLIQAPDTNVLDVRNSYEIRLGHFRRAIDPDTQSFRQFERWAANASAALRDKRTALYCTGGIRCEKAAQTLAANGFSEIYQLDQGILGYFASTAERSLWHGECFVFDKRVSILPDLSQGTATQCHGCRRPLTERDRESEHYVPGVSCAACVGDLTSARREGLLERTRQIQFAKKHNLRHLGPSEHHGIPHES